MKKLKLRYSEIITPHNLMRVWKAFLRGKKRRADVHEFQVRLTDHLFNLSRDLREQTYTHGGYQSFSVSDPKPRSIHKASVRDRVVHHLLYDALYGHFDARFIYDLYSCRNNKGTHRALVRFADFGRTVSRNSTRTCWVLKCDVRKFFASIDHGKLKCILRKHIDSDETLRLLGRVIDSFHTPGLPGVGLPLGNLTSQLLTNLYMDTLDQFAKRALKTRFYIRYADDFVILSHDRDWLASLVPRIGAFLRDELGLMLHPRKVYIRTLASGVDFLGWVHFPDHRVLRTATKRRMFRSLVRDAKPERVASYLGMLSHGNAYSSSETIKKLVL